MLKQCSSCDWKGDEKQARKSTRYAGVLICPVCDAAVFEDYPEGKSTTVSWRYYIIRCVREFQKGQPEALEDFLSMYEDMRKKAN